MKHQSKWMVLIDTGDKLVERIIPAKNKRQAAERCSTGENRIINIKRYEGVSEMDKPDLYCFWQKKVQMLS